MLSLISQPGVSVAPQTTVGVALRQPLSAKLLCWTTAASELRQHAILEVSEEKLYRQGKRQISSWKQHEKRPQISMQDITSLAIRKGFQLEKRWHSLSGNIKTFLSCTDDPQKSIPKYVTVWELPATYSRSLCRTEETSVIIQADSQKNTVINIQSNTLSFPMQTLQAET